MARTGRPRLKEPRREGIFIRLTEQEHKDIREYAKLHNQTITRTLVDGFYSLKRKESES